MIDLSIRRLAKAAIKATPLRVLLHSPSRSFVGRCECGDCPRFSVADIASDAAHEWLRETHSRLERATGTTKGRRETTFCTHLALPPSALVDARPCRGLAIQVDEADLREFALMLRGRANLADRIATDLDRVRKQTSSHRDVAPPDVTTAGVALAEPAYPTARKQAEVPSKVAVDSAKSDSARTGGSNPPSGAEEEVCHVTASEDQPATPPAAGDVPQNAWCPICLNGSGPACPACAEMLQLTEGR